MAILSRRDLLYQYRGWIIGLLVGIVLCAIMIVLLPVGNDYNRYYYTTADKWLHGETRLYDDASEGYYNPPWMLPLYFPFTFFPLKLSLILVDSIALLVMLVGVWLLRRLHPTPDWVLVAVMVNMCMFWMLFIGQMDWLIFFGVVLGWWGIAKRQPWILAVGFWLMSMKPLNVILVGALYLISIRSWRMGEIARALSLTIFSLLICFPLIGWDYPLRYLESYRDNPPDAFVTATVWKSVAAFGLPQEILILPLIVAVLAFLWAAWKYQTEAWTVALAVATNFTISNYVYGYHFVTLIPALFFVANRSKRLALIAYIFTWSPLFRGIIQNNQFLIDVLYPVLLFFMLWWLERQRLRPVPHPL